MRENSVPALAVTPLDLVLAALAVVLALILFLWPAGQTGSVCIISWAEGDMILPLAEDTVFSLESSGCHLEISVEDSQVRVSYADCPDGVCVSTGSISREGQIIVCVPAGVVVRIPGIGADGADFYL